MRVIKYVAAGSFLAFCISGFISIFFDFDHIWWLFGMEEPINFTGFYGRPFHTAPVAILVSIICAIIVATFIRRWIKYERIRNEL